MQINCSAGLRIIRAQLLRAETAALNALPRSRAGTPHKATALQLYRAAELQARMERVLNYAEAYYLMSFFKKEPNLVPVWRGSDMRKEQELSDPNSCLNRAEPFELVFTLLARDAAAPVAIRAWIAERLRLGKNVATDAQIQNAERCANLMELERVNRK